MRPAVHHALPTHLPTRKLGHGDLVPYARQISHAAHAGQVDKADNPYVDHPTRIVHALGAADASDFEIAVGWLHDVVEDTGVTLTYLRALGFPSEVLVPLDAITRRPGEHPFAYYKRVARNQTALNVKFCDINDNYDPKRLALLADELSKRLDKKYRKAVVALVAVAVANGLYVGKRRSNAAERFAASLEPAVLAELVAAVAPAVVVVPPSISDQLPGEQLDGVDFLAVFQSA